MKTATNAVMPSCINALHTRFEQASAELVTVSNAESEARTHGSARERWEAEAAMHVLGREIDALRMALLYQVPDTRREAMTLQFHIVGAAHDQTGGGVDLQAEALLIATDTLFDFLCCETDEDHEAIGPEFRDEANRVFFKRRMRTGVVEG
ncbi:hypothetical protein ASG11_09895 [Sphingomonas sp. Leaf357]|uniref:hypothetical protein n=1 Tax=Sphingomonas sp. Leaf357 TaxID=1736350 RepID=UPI0006F2BE37|nr:hypothetical protein [Sphingomonas sp. Leaf357]KQS04522.1 hypothetical protein ASG11_09895 [Sphingomonas sp. Leaf357]